MCRLHVSPVYKHGVIRISFKVSRAGTGPAATHSLSGKVALLARNVPLVVEEAGCWCRMTHTS